MPDITKGKTFTSGEMVDAGDMNSIIDLAVINNDAITESKIASGAVVNDTVSASANIELSKLASGTDGQIPVCSVSGVPTYVTLTGVTVTNAGAVSLGRGAATPVGAMIPYAGTSAPTGWLICDGTEKDSVSDTTLADLYTAIGTRYGGSGAAAFNLPDMRGRVAVAADGSAGRLASNDAAGESGGEESHTLTFDEMPDGKYAKNGVIFNHVTAQVTGPNSPDFGSSSDYEVGGDTPMNNMQPYQVVDNYIIKT